MSRLCQKFTKKTLKKLLYFKRFIEDHESKQEEEAEVVEPHSNLEGKMDVFHLLVGLLLLSKLTKKERIKTLYEWFTCFEDEADPGLEEDDFLLPLKTISLLISIFKFLLFISFLRLLKNETKLISVVSS